jgi:hypothetical protein
MVASSKESVSKAWNVTKGERKDHLTRAGGRHTWIVEPFSSFSLFVSLFMIGTSRKLNILPARQYPEKIMYFSTYPNGRKNRESF